MAVMQYARLFQIECLHAYFGGGLCRSLAMAPTEDCRQMLSRYQMFFRPAAAGGTVYCPAESTPDLLKQFDETAPFTFALTSSDPTLNNYTDVDLGSLDLRESIFYFDNRDDHATEISNQPRQMLHEPGKPFAHGPVPVHMKTFSLSPAEHQGSTDFRITEPLGNRVILQGTIPRKDIPVPIDLRAAPEGLYMLHIGAEPPTPFYLTDQPAVRWWGAISIYAGGTRQPNLPENCRTIDTGGRIRLKTFALSLESRKTIWRYYIVPSADKTDKQDFSQFVVNAGKKPGASDLDIPFSLLPETAPVDGRPAWVFESKSALPLLQSPSSAFALTLRPNKNGKLGQRSIRLPYAQPLSMVPKEGAEPRQMCSEIFVYV